jgi:hypothetical protein
MTCLKGNQEKQMAKNWKKSKQKMYRGIFSPQNILPYE